MQHPSLADSSGKPTESGFRGISFHSEATQGGPNHRFCDLQTFLDLQTPSDQWISGSALRKSTQLTTSKNPKNQRVLQTVHRGVD